MSSILLFDSDRSSRSFMLTWRLWTSNCCGGGSSPVVDTPGCVSPLLHGVGGHWLLICLDSYAFLYEISS